jgi:Fur family ferric uptake transcriptional regulator
VSRRDDVVATLAQAQRFVSAQTLYADIRADGIRIGLATVYRILQALVSEGRADLVRTPDGEALYRICGSDRHHHHLLCRRCGHAVNLDDDTLEAWARSMAAAHGFTAVEHVIEITGECAGCSGRSPGR